LKYLILDESFILTYIAHTTQTMYRTTETNPNCGIQRYQLGETLSQIKKALKMLGYSNQKYDPKFSEEQLFEQLSSVDTTPDLAGYAPIVAVGPAIGFFEGCLKKHMKVFLKNTWTEIICAGPDPADFFGEDFVSRISKKYSQDRIYPHCLHVSDITRKLPGIVRNNFLILNWLSPEYGDNSLDVGYISSLKPIGLFVSYETRGGSGSERLIQLLDQKTFDVDGVNYKLYSRRTLTRIRQAFPDFAILCSVVYIREDNYPVDHQVEIYESEERYDDSC